MPWSEILPMDERLRFIADHQNKLFSMTELCARYGVSRKTGYKWVRRYEMDGPAGLYELPRKPHSCPHQTPPELVEQVLGLRKRHPDFGSKKLLQLLRERKPKLRWPARSTIDDILKRHGLVPKRRRTRRPGHPGRPVTPMTSPNEIWTVDFKGEFRTRDGIYCYPLTVEDGYSRYLLACRGLYGTRHRETKQVLRQLFRQYGLPEIIRSDNGAPFASTALGRLSRLSVWWVRLGIYPELIEPGHPEQNGRHERMHRTLKERATRPPGSTLRGQQRKFNDFLRYYNEDRPHESLGQRRPASVYQPSNRQYPEKLEPLEYPGHYEVRLVSRNGGLRWNGVRVPVSHVLEGEYVGLEEIDDGVWEVYFGPLRLGRLNERDMRIEDVLGRKRRRRLLPMSPD